PVAGHVIGGDDELVAGRDGDWAVREPAEPDLRALEVDEDADAAAGVVACLAYATVDGFVVGVAAVAQVEPRDVQAGLDELPDALRARRGRTERRDDLRPGHTATLSALACPAVWRSVIRPPGAAIVLDCWTAKTMKAQY